MEANDFEMLKKKKKHLASSMEGRGTKGEQAIGPSTKIKRLT